MDGILVVREDVVIHRDRMTVKELARVLDDEKVLLGGDETRSTHPDLDSGLLNPVDADDGTIEHVHVSEHPHSDGSLVNALVDLDVREPSGLHEAVEDGVGESLHLFAFGDSKNLHGVAAEGVVVIRDDTIKVKVHIVSHTTMVDEAFVDVNYLMSRVFRNETRAGSMGSAGPERKASRTLGRSFNVVSLNGDFFQLSS